MSKHPSTLTSTEPPSDPKANRSDSRIPAPRYLNTKDAAAYLGVSTRWLEELRGIGGGPEYSKFGRKKVVYCIDDLDSWAQRHRRRNTSQPDPKSEEV